MPLNAFWALVGNVHKIEADEDRRALRIAIACQGSETAKALFDDFDDRLKEVVKVAPASPMDAKPDLDGIKDLKRLLQQMQ